MSPSALFCWLHMCRVYGVEYVVFVRQRIMVTPSTAKACREAAHTESPAN